MLLRVGAPILPQRNPASATAISVTYLHSKILDAPHGPNSFNFIQFLGKFGKIIYRRPPSPGGCAPPPRGNPGSATEYYLLNDPALPDLQVYLPGRISKTL